MKDLFSGISGQYAKFRPEYPKEVFDFIFKIVEQRSIALDCGTGNGQLAAQLAAGFDKVFAIDISSSQIENGVRKPNIEYSIQPAERMTFPDHYFDLVTVGQAIHWFDLEKFYNEVKRILKPGGFIFVIGYGRLSVDQEVDAVIDELYTSTLKGYWEKERKYIDENYLTIPFPFKELTTPEFCMKHTWNMRGLLGYLRTWSAVRKYIATSGLDPVDKVASLLSHRTNEFTVTFPVLIRAGN
jgi:SAM-dependent methyltransferase